MEKQTGNDTYPYGRYWGGADKAIVRGGDDYATVELRWNDGKFIVMDHFATEAEAFDYLETLGFARAVS